MAPPRSLRRRCLRKGGQGHFLSARSSRHGGQRQEEAHARPLLLPVSVARRGLRGPAARPLPVEGLHVAVLGRHCHAAQVGLVAHRLEVAAAQKDIHRSRAAPLRQRQGLVDLVQFAMTAAGHSHPHRADEPRNSTATPSTTSSPDPTVENTGQVPPGRLPPTLTQPRRIQSRYVTSGFQVSREKGWERPGSHRREICLSSGVRESYKSEESDSLKLEKDIKISKNSTSKDNHLKNKLESKKRFFFP